MVTDKQMNDAHAEEWLYKFHPKASDKSIEKFTQFYNEYLKFGFADTPALAKALNKLRTNGW